MCIRDSPYVSYEKQGVLYDRRNLAAPFLIEVSRDLTGRGIATCAVPALSLIHI